MADRQTSIGKLSIDDIFALEREMSEAGEESLSQDEKEKYKVVRNIVEKIEAGGAPQEVVRDAIFEAVKSSFKDVLVFGDEEDNDDSNVDSGAEIIKQKRGELYEILDNMDQHIAGKSIEEVSAFFMSLLDIQSQLCMQKTEGVITVKARLFNFFSLPDKEDISPALRQEISLIFTPEEVSAMRMKLPELPSDNPMKPFFTMVLDQAYDVLQYSEMTGNLLLEMTNYFLIKLNENGHSENPKVLDFQERHDRCRISLRKSLEDLHSVEIVIQKHLKDRPVLLDLPKALRSLIQIKIGLLDSSSTPAILQKVKSLLGDYSRARSAVAFDFNRLPSYQHGGVRLRQSVILNLQKDTLKFAGEQMEQEFRTVKAEMDKMLAEIETQSETLDPNSPEFENLMKKKEQIQNKLETQRRKLDVVRSQQSLVDVQHQMVGEAIQRYQKNESSYQKLEENLKKHKNKIDTKPTPSIKKSKPTRMAMARKVKHG